MPEVTRVGLDTHVGHASPTPNPFHQTAYASGSPDVKVNGISVHRKGDATGGHASFVPNASASGSPNVFAGG